MRTQSVVDGGFDPRGGVAMPAGSIEIIVNGAPRPAAPDTTLAHLVKELGLTGKRLAIEVNEEVVPRGEYSSFALGPGDRVEIVHAIGGG